MSLIFELSPEQCLIVNSSSDHIFNGLIKRQIPLKETTWLDLNPETIEPNTCILFDDCYGHLKQNELRKLTRILNVICRHKNCPVILITHSISSVHFRPLLSFFKSIYVSQNPRNRNTFDSLLKSLKVDKKKRQGIIEDFLKKGERRNEFYFVFCDKSTGLYEVKDLKPIEEKKDDLEALLDEKKRKILERGETYFKIWKEHQFGIVLLDWILQNLDLNLINEKDFTLPVFLSDKCYKVNLIQFCFDVIKPEKHPCMETIMLLNYFIIYNNFPPFFLKNPKLLKHFQQLNIQRKKM